MRRTPPAKGRRRACTASCRPCSWRRSKTSRTAARAARTGSRSSRNAESRRQRSAGAFADQGAQVGLVTLQVPRRGETLRRTGGVVQFAREAAVVGGEPVGVGLIDLARRAVQAMQIGAHLGDRVVAARV